MEAHGAGRGDVEAGGEGWRVGGGVTRPRRHGARLGAESLRVGHPIGVGVGGSSTAYRPITALRCPADRFLQPTTKVATTIST